MNANEAALLIAECSALRFHVEELHERAERASDILRGHFQQVRYVDTVPFAVVSEALGVLAGEDG